MLHEGQALQKVHGEQVHAASCSGEAFCRFFLFVWFIFEETEPVLDSGCNLFVGSFHIVDLVQDAAGLQKLLACGVIQEGQAPFQPQRFLSFLESFFVLKAVFAPSCAQPALSDMATPKRQAHSELPALRDAAMLEQDNKNSHWAMPRR